MGKNSTTFIPARKFFLGQLLVWWLIRSSLRKHFDRVVFRMTDERTPAQKKLPLIVCANHSSWWDGYVAAVLQHYLKVDTYLMMEEAQLRRYFFFRWIGCFSVNRQNARSALQSLHYAAHLFKELSHRMIWLFPQGEISPNDRRPLVFFTGAAHLARLSAPAYLSPLAIRIEYLGEQRPVLFISMGSPLLITTEECQQANFLKNCTRQLEACVTSELDTLRDDIIAGRISDFTLLQHGQSSTNRIFDAVLLRKNK